MDTIPLILGLLKSNALLYSIALSGNIDSAMASYNQQCIVLSEYAVRLDNFILSPSDTFDFATLICPPGGSSVAIHLFTKSAKYQENVVAYFGNKTVYHKVIHVYKEHGIMPKSPYRYCYPDFNPPAYVALRHLSTGNYCISFEFGTHVCEGKEFSLPGEKEE